MQKDLKIIILTIIVIVIISLIINIKTYSYNYNFEKSLEDLNSARSKSYDYALAAEKNAKNESKINILLELVYLKSGQFEKAKKELEILKKKDSNYYFYYLSEMGVILMLENSNLSEEYFNKSIKEDPNYYVPYVGLALLNAKEKKWNQTMELINISIRKKEKVYEYKKIIRRPVFDNFIYYIIRDYENIHNKTYNFNKTNLEIINWPELFGVVYTGIMSDIPVLELNK